MSSDNDRNPTEETYKNELASFMRRLYRHKLTTTLGGNLSMLLPDGNMIITPSATDKGKMKGSDIGTMDLAGNIIGKEFKPTIESQMHINIYQARQDVKAIVHAHPVTACAFGASSAEINNSLIVESYVVLGNIAYADYYPMGTIDLADAVAKAADNANCIIMKNHGALTVGTTMLQAFDRLEVLESAAKMTILTEGFLNGAVNPLNKTHLDAIDNSM